MTMASPASNPLAMLTVLSARSTGTPSPGAPTIAAITTMERLSMMHWVTPAMMVGMACGSSTFHRSWRRVAPKASPASTRGRGTLETPRWVSRIGAGNGEDHRRDQARHHPQAEHDHGRDQIDEGRDGLHQVEHRAEGVVEPGPVRRCDADRHADDNADHGREQDQGERLDRIFPIAQVDDQQQRQHDRDDQLPRPVQPEGKAGEHGHQQ